MVPIHDRHRTKRLMESTQRHFVAEEPAIPVAARFPLLHRDCRPGPAVLGSGDLRQFHLFQ
jgi:hypothetical protein